MRYGVFIEYMWDIRGVFTGYSYVSGMYRVCVGYVSGMRRNIWGAKKVLRNGTDHGIARNYTEARGLLSPFRYAQEIL